MQKNFAAGKKFFLPQKIFSHFLVQKNFAAGKNFFLPQKIFGHFLVLFFILRRAKKIFCLKNFLVTF